MSLFRKLFRSRRPSAPPFRPAVESLEERQALSGAYLSPQQRLLNSLHRLPVGHFRSHLPTNAERIISGSYPGHLNRLPTPRPTPTRLPLNRPPRVIPVPYLDPWAPEDTGTGDSSGYNGGGGTPHVGYYDNAPRRLALVSGPFFGWGAAPLPGYSVIQPYPGPGIGYGGLPDWALAFGL